MNLRTIWICHEKCRNCTQPQLQTKVAMEPDQGRFALGWNSDSPRPSVLATLNTSAMYAPRCMFTTLSINWAESAMKKIEDNSIWYSQPTVLTREDTTWCMDWIQNLALLYQNPLASKLQKELVTADRISWTLWSSSKQLWTGIFPTFVSWVQAPGNLYKRQDTFQSWSMKEANAE